MGRRIKVIEPITYLGKHFAPGRLLRVTREEEKRLCELHEEKVIVIDIETKSPIDRLVPLSQEAIDRRDAKLQALKEKGFGKKVTKKASSKSIISKSKKSQL